MYKAEKFEDVIELAEYLNDKKINRDDIVFINYIVKDSCISMIYLDVVSDK